MKGHFKQGNNVIKINSPLLISFLLFLLLVLSLSEIPPYHSTENVGQNKKERIDSVEKYLIDLSQSLREMDTKIDENAKKVKGLEESVKDTLKELRSLTDKKEQASIDDKKTLVSKEARVDKSEMDKIREDILFLKNKDIEKLKIDFDELRELVKRLEQKERVR